MIFQSNVFDQFNSVMEKGDVARFRVYEVSSVSLPCFVNFKGGCSHLER